MATVIVVIVFPGGHMRVTSNGKVWRSKAEWQTLCERFAKSGFGQQEFCQRESIPVGSFKKWHQRCKETEQISCPPAPPAVFEKSMADVSLLAGLLIDKFAYHLPLYRQHQHLVPIRITQLWYTPASDPDKSKETVAAPGGGE
jgi:hypothetical protein